MNPKDKVGKTKPPMALIPPAAELECCLALKNGLKYGPFNWRETPIEFMEYLHAIRRHFAAVLDGEDLDPESGVRHLGHIMATCAIVIDAQSIGTLNDNRPVRGNAAELIRACVTSSGGKDGRKHGSGSKTSSAGASGAAKKSRSTGGRRAPNSLTR